MEISGAPADERVQEEIAHVEIGIGSVDADRPEARRIYQKGGVDARLAERRGK